MSSAEIRLKRIQQEVALIQKNQQTTLSAYEFALSKDHPVFGQ